jgi:hypothetical protein
MSRPLPYNNLVEMKMNAPHDWSTSLLTPLTCHLIITAQQFAIKNCFIVRESRGTRHTPATIL